MKRFILFFLFFSPLTSAGTVAIIIDDIGYHAHDIQAVALPGAVTLAVLPHTPYGQEFAQLAHQHGKQVILHIPMQAERGNKLGPGALTIAMNAQQIDQHLSQAFKEIPFAVGINNHMGSLFTQQSHSMLATMTFLKKHRLFFVDSITTEQSKTAYAARKAGVARLKRHVFLDNSRQLKQLTKQWQELIARSKYQPFVIGIAHPFPKTISFLEQHIPQLKQQDIELVAVSQLITL